VVFDGREIEMGQIVHFSAVFSVFPRKMTWV